MNGSGGPPSPKSVHQTPTIHPAAAPRDLRARPPRRPSGTTTPQPRCRTSQQGARRSSSCRRPSVSIRAAECLEVRRQRRVGLDGEEVARSELEQPSGRLPGPGPTSRTLIPRAEPAPLDQALRRRARRGRGARRSYAARSAPNRRRPSLRPIRGTGSVPGRRVVHPAAADHRRDDLERRAARPARTASGSRSSTTRSAR